MFCSKCGNQITEGARFCSACGAPVAEIPVSVEAVEVTPEVMPELSEGKSGTQQSKSLFDEIDWNVTEYPGSDWGGKTEDIDFDWNADPKDIRDRYTRGLSTREKAEVNARADLEVEDVIPVREPEAVAVPEPAAPAPAYEELSASDKIDKFYTFSSQNEEFQKLLNKEYGKIQSGNLIKHEQNEADKVAAKKFEERELDPSMDAFLEREGIVKPYEPKAFESDVLQRIEAQERAKEEAILEEEARERAMEEARLQAAEEARAKAAEEARMAAEAARKAEEEARIAAEREALIRAEEEERLREEHREAMLKAQAELRAHQEAEKIRAQQEARRIKLEEEKQLAEIERRRRDEAELRDRLSREQENISVQADSAATAEEVRKVLAQTARMREEEAAKIRAAVAGLRGEEHLKDTPAMAEIAQPETPSVIEPVIEPVPAVPVQPVEIEKTVPVEDKANIDAHEATRSDLNDMAKARMEFLEEFGRAEEPDVKPEPVAEKRHTPTTMEELLGEKPVTGRNTMHSESSDMTATRVVDKAAVLAGMESTMRINKDEIKKQDELKKEEVQIPEPVVAVPVAAAQPASATVEDLLQQFDEKNSEEKPLDLNELVGEGYAPKEEPGVTPVPEAAEEKKPGLDNTMVMPENLTESIPGDFDSYGEREAEEFRRRQEAASAMDSFYADTEETTPAENEETEEYIEEPKKKKGGAGRVILKILLVILIVIFAVELAGIAIKFLAPNSSAAKFIDTQLNKVIQLITGYEPNYTIDGIDYEV